MSATGRSWNSAGVDVLRFLLIALAAMFVVVGAGAALMQLVTGGNIQAAQIISAMLLLVGSLTAALLLLAVATALRLLVVQIRHVEFTHHTMERLQQSILLLQETTSQIPQQMAAVPPIVPAARELAADSGFSDAASQQMLDLLTQIRDLSLMSDAQRLELGKQHWDKRKEYLVRLIDQNAAAGDFAVAAQHVRELQAIAPDEVATEQLAENIREKQSQMLADAVTAARSKMRHLMSISAWPQAEEVVRTLQRDFSGAADAQALADELTHEREAFDKENLARLSADLKDASEHRQWRRAYQTAEELIRRYPHEKKVEKLKADIHTIKENAESQERREQEELFKDLLKRQRYDDALSVANAVINKFPASTAAMELNKLVPKVEELIRQEQMKRQQGTVV